ncbi:hypothetical protein MPH_03413 [Macrophomina phaseolina MS6]|uniref:Uncharacterized protein n=1 Tax=Macrophomina phaseolina (strain MS6) TaxID=1126212 RepID=K2SAY5_MACPH|nr:hypothetical protein MPH_03413 [Macrophomina phaseolina MS6]
MSSDNPGAASTKPGESNSTLGANTKTEVKEEELDSSVAADIVSTDYQPDAMNLDGANDMDTQQSSSNQASGAGTAPGQEGILPGAPPASELRIPTKKDASLREFLSKMDDYAPIVRPAPPFPRSKKRKEMYISLHPETITTSSSTSSQQRQHS